MFQPFIFRGVYTRFDRFNQRINQIRNAQKFFTCRISEFKTFEILNPWLEDVGNAPIFRENHSKSPSIWSPQYIFRHITRAHTKFPKFPPLPPTLLGTPADHSAIQGGPWWLSFNPFEKYARQNGNQIFPKFRTENKKCLKPPPSFCCCQKKLYSLVCVWVCFGVHNWCWDKMGSRFGYLFYLVWGASQDSKLINSNQVTSFRIHGEYEGLLVSTWRQEKSGNSTVTTFKARRTIFGINPSPPPVMSIVVV